MGQDFIHQFKQKPDSTKKRGGAKGQIKALLKPLLKVLSKARSRFQAPKPAGGAEPGAAFAASKAKAKAGRPSGRRRSRFNIPLPSPVTLVLIAGTILISLAVLSWRELDSLIMEEGASGAAESGGAVNQGTNNGGSETISVIVPVPAASPVAVSPAPAAAPVTVATPVALPAPVIVAQPVAALAATPAPATATAPAAATASNVVTVTFAEPVTAPVAVPAPVFAAATRPVVIPPAASPASTAPAPAVSGSVAPAANLPTANLPTAVANLQPIEIEVSEAPADLSPRFQWQTYHVQRGDSVSVIASRFGISMDAVIASNDIQNARRLREGDVLRIPNMDGIPHVVQSGDSISQISSVHNVPQDSIIQANNLGSGYLHEGATIFIPGGRMSPETLRLSLGEQFVWPVRRDITSPFGWRNDPFTGLRSFHRGIDLRGSIGTPIRATKDGTVAVVGSSRVYGNYIILSHAGGVQTLYAHLSTFAVREGERVRQGAIIGAVGNTGLSTGPHLHFGVHRNGNWVNPIDFLH
ncbi:MAG: M23 family metallopeptidase [Spirochaetes bacterium]|nr:M23 family metallopeptidase [Spirochaetota bacterium]